MVDDKGEAELLATLKENKQWVCWTYEERDGDKTKPPIAPVDGTKYASTADPDTWATYEGAVAYHERDDTDTEGVGYALKEEGVVVGADLDGCRHPDTGELEPWAEDIIDRLDTYTEVSPSDTGVRAFLLGLLPDGRNKRPQERTIDLPDWVIENKKAEVELYDSGRYMTFTGEHIEGAPTDVKQRADTLQEIHAEYVADGDENTSLDEFDPEDTPDLDLDDEEILEKARNSENGEKFSRLYDGYDGYHSDDTSRADLAFCGMLAFWTGGDRDQMDRIFRNSGRMRAKWDEDRGSQTYGELTIEKALENRTEFYDPGNTPNSEPSMRAETDGGASAAAGGGSVQDPAAPAWDAVRNEYNIARQQKQPKSHPRYKASERLLSDHDFVNVRESDELYIYDPDDGIYRDRGQREVRETARKGLGRWFQRSEVSELCEHIRAVKTRPYDDLGGPEWHIPVRNGVIKMDSGRRELVDHSPEFRFLHRAGTEFDPEAECPMWEEFLEDSVRSASERDKLQEYVGYALYHWGLPHHKGLFLVGPKASGKSTFLDMVRELIGPAGVSNVTPQQMTERFGGAELFGNWANIRSDIPSEMINNTGEFKEIAAGDPIKAEKKHQDPFMFQPTAKHFYSANTLPDTEDDDDAFYRRILLVAFPSSVPEPEQDRKLTEKLKGELPGVLNWALDGLQRLVDQGGFTNDRTTGATADTWQKWGNTVDRFASVCVETGADTPIPKKDVYHRYIRFCEQENMPAEPQRVFTRRLKTEHGVTDGKAHVEGRQQRCFLNVGFTGRAERYADDRGDESGGTGTGLDSF